MTYSFTEITADSIEGLFGQTVASVLTRNHSQLHLHKVTQGTSFLCYRAVRRVQFPGVILFDLEQECSWQSCLEIGNQTFAEFLFPLEDQKIHLFLRSYKEYQTALNFFEVNNFEYEMSTGYDEGAPGYHDFLVVKKVVPVIPKIGLILPKIMEMLGIR